MWQKKYKKAKVILTLLVLATVLGVSPSWALDPTHPDYGLYKEIENSLMCTDECGMTLVACDNATAAQMRYQIRQFIEEGQTREEILQSFVNIYGMEVLTFPPREGFNISAWVVPFIAILGGGLSIYLALDKWVFKNEEYELELEEKEDNDDINLDDYEETLEDERKKYF